MLKKRNSCAIVLLLIAACFWGCKVNNYSELPLYTDYRTPVPAPAPPGEPFKPKMAGSARSHTPLSAEWTRTAGPDESIIVTGEEFSNFNHSNKGKDTRFRVFSADGVLRDASVLRAEKSSAVITVDKATPGWSMYLIWPGNKSGYGRPIAVNKTDAWWLGPDRAERGGVASVYGRNLSQDNDTLVSNIYIKMPGGAGVWAEVVKVNPYKVDFMVPSYLSDGVYEVWAHNGHGSKYGWSGPLQLVINERQKWSQKVVNVRDYGAKGDGKQDDTEAILKAVEVASKVPGSTVFYPAGTYMISKTLRLSDGMRWLGEGRDRTVIACAENFFTNDAMIAGKVKDVELSRLTFDTNKNYRGSGREFRSEAINLDGSTRLKIDNVGFSCVNYSVLRLDNSVDVSITNSKIVGKKSFLGSSSGLVIDRCDFYLTNDTENALHSWGGKRIRMTNSTCRDLANSDRNDGTGWGKGRFFHAAGNGGSTCYTYLENNRTIDLGVRPYGPDQNSGEQFLWEGFAARWSGNVLSSSGTKTILAKFSKEIKPFKLIAVITEGRGLGQSRWISSIEGSALILERPWNVAPDKSSTVVIGNFADKIVLYKNFIDGKASDVKSDNLTASSGIQPYGGVFNFIADRNILTDLRTGIANWSTQHSTGIDPNYFNLYVNNSITNCRTGILNALMDDREAATGLMGTTYRGNHINNALVSGISVWLYAMPSAVMENFLYEHNTFLNVPKGFHIRDNRSQSVATQTLYKNHFSTRSGLYAIDISPGIKLRSNTYTGFSDVYAGGPMRGDISAPVHVVEIEANGTNDIIEVPFTIWNTGATSVNLDFHSGARWLEVARDSARILQTERESSRVILKANPNGLSPKTYSADLRVTSGDQVKKYTVIMKVTEADGKKIALNSDDD